MKLNVSIFNIISSFVLFIKNERFRNLNKALIIIREFIKKRTLVHLLEIYSDSGLNNFSFFEKFAEFETSTACLCAVQQESLYIIYVFRFLKIASRVYYKISGTQKMQKKKYFLEPSTFLSISDIIISNLIPIEIIQV